MYQLNQTESCHFFLVWAVLGEEAPITIAELQHIQNSEHLPKLSFCLCYRR